MKRVLPFVFGAACIGAIVFLGGAPAHVVIMAVITFVAAGTCQIIENCG